MIFFCQPREKSNPQSPRRTFQSFGLIYFFVVHEIGSFTNIQRFRRRGQQDINVIPGLISFLNNTIKKKEISHEREFSAKKLIINGTGDIAEMALKSPSKNEITMTQGTHSTLTQAPAEPATFPLKLYAQFSQWVINYLEGSARRMCNLLQNMSQDGNNGSD